MRQVMKVTTFICVCVFMMSFGLNANEIMPARGQIKAENSAYVLKKQKYVQKHLQENFQYSLSKARAYLDRSRKERDYLLQQLYETKLIEEIELRLEDYTDAKEEALEELESKKSSYAILYDKYLIPSLEKLVEELKQDQNCQEKCDAIVDHYIMGYRAIFSPDKYRSEIFRDLPILENITILNGIEIAKNDPKKIEANNLIVSKQHLAEIQKCLGPQSKAESYLNEE